MGLAGIRGREDIGVTDHRIEGRALVGWHGEGGPDLEPGTRVFVDLFVADFDADLFDHSVTDVIHPIALEGRILCRIRRERGKINFQEEGIEEFGLAGENTGDAAPEVGGAVEFNRDGFNGEGCVAAIDVFEESGLRIAGQIRILASTGHQL